MMLVTGGSRALVIDEAGRRHLRDRRTHAGRFTTTGLGRTGPT
jgi:hypothetical protein